MKKFSSSPLVLINDIYGAGHVALFYVFSANFLTFCFYLSISYLIKLGLVIIMILITTGKRQVENFRF